MVAAVLAIASGWACFDRLREHSHLPDPPPALPASLVLASFLPLWGAMAVVMPGVPLLERAPISAAIAFLFVVLARGAAAGILALAFDLGDRLSQRWARSLPQTP